jgi:putative FmdB family regulatory protein
MFEYRCGDCGKEFEAFVTGERTAACPACHGENLAKLLSSPGMVGSGHRAEPASFPMAGGCGTGMCGCRANQDLN